MIRVSWRAEVCAGQMCNLLEKLFVRLQKAFIDESAHNSLFLLVITRTVVFVQLLKI